MNVQSTQISPLKAASLLASALTALALAGCGSNTTASKAGSDASQSDSSAHEIAAAQLSAPAAAVDGGIIDVCSLVSLADAESILAAPAKLSEHEPDDKRTSSCHFASADEQGRPISGLMVEIHTDEDVNEAKQDIALARKIRSGSETLSGIGDDALLWVNKQPDLGADAPAALVAMQPDQQVLVAIKGAKKIEIETDYFGKPRTTDSLKALAKKLAEHI